MLMRQQDPSPKIRARAPLIVPRRRAQPKSSEALEEEHDAVRPAASTHAQGSDAGYGELIGLSATRRSSTHCDLAADDATVAVNDATASRSATTSEPLPSGLVWRLSRAYGQDLGEVRVLADSKTADALGVRAFTTGDTIAFATGEYQPDTPEGRLLIAHEVAHVVQQTKAAESRGDERTEARREHEAEVAAGMALAGLAVPPLSAAPMGAMQFAPSRPPEGSPSATTPTAPPKVAPPATPVDQTNAHSIPTLIDLSSGRIDSSTIHEDGKIQAQIPKLGATGVITLRKRKDGKVESKGKGDGLELKLPMLAFLNSSSLVLVVTVNNDEVEGYVTVGTPEKYVSKSLTGVFAALKDKPGDLGFLGLSGVNFENTTNEFKAGELNLGTGLVFTLGGWVPKASGRFEFKNYEPQFSGSAKIKIGGANDTELDAAWSREKGLTGTARLEVKMGPVTGEGAVRLHDGVVDAQATLKYDVDRLSGSVTVILTDAKTAKGVTSQVTPEGGLPSIFDAPDTSAPASEGAAPGAATPDPAKTGPGQRGLAGWGELDFALTDWLTGRAMVVMNSEGKVTIVGKIAPPKEIVLFEQKDWVKELFKVEARASYGIPIIGNVFVFANIGLEALATIGPGKLYNIELNGTFSTDEKADQSLDLKASLNISAFAGLRLRAEGGAGVEILAHDIKAGVGVNALAGVRGYVEATPTIGMRQPAGGECEYYIKGHMDIAAQMFLGLSGDLFIEVDGPWWSPVDGEKWTWPLGGVEYPLPGEFGIGADVEHVLGSKTWPEVQFSDVSFDAGKFTSDLLRESPPKGGSGEKEKPGKWQEGTAEQVPPGEKAPPVATGKEGAEPETQVNKPVDKEAVPTGKEDAGPGKNESKPVDKAVGTTEPDKTSPEKASKSVDKGEVATAENASKPDDKATVSTEKDVSKSDDKEVLAAAALGERVSFTAGGETYALWVQLTGQRATLMIGNPKQAAVSWIKAHGKQGATGSQTDFPKPAAFNADALALAEKIDASADQLAADKGDREALKRRNEAIKADLRSLAALLSNRQSATEFKKVELNEVTLSRPFIAKEKVGDNKKLAMTKAELIRQVAIQEAALNRLKVSVWKANWARFYGDDGGGGGRQDQAQADREREELINAEKNKTKDQWLKNNPGKTIDDANRFVADLFAPRPGDKAYPFLHKYLSYNNIVYTNTAYGMALLHAADQVAGGGSETAGLGGARENFSIGAQWSRGGRAQILKGQLDTEINNASGGGDTTSGDAALLNVRLPVVDG